MSDCRRTPWRRSRRGSARRAGPWRLVDLVAEGLGLGAGLVDLGGEGGDGLLGGGLDVGDGARSRSPCPAGRLRGRSRPRRASWSRDSISLSRSRTATARLVVLAFSRTLSSSSTVPRSEPNALDMTALRSSSSWRTTVVRFLVAASRSGRMTGSLRSASERKSRLVLSALRGR